jgi:O-succinylbenzoic acid--CoA ligase
MTELSIAAAAREAGQSIALVCAGRSHTFGELAELARARGGELDVRERVPYPLSGTNALDTLVTLYALLERRIPALLLHPRLTETERRALLATAARLGPVAHDDAAAVLFTSGTTGTPRGAVLTRRALVASACASAANLGWRDDDRWLACMTLAHVGGLSIVTRCLAARRCVVLAERFDAATFVRHVRDDRVTLASLVPTMLARVLDVNPQWTPPRQFRAVLLGGAAASTGLRARAVDRGVPLLATYGLTEACSQVTTTSYQERLSRDDFGSGVPLPGVRLRVVKGRIEVSGETLMAGYWNEAPLAPGAWFDTGDIGELDARGRLHVHGRRTELIVTGGENVYPADVEHALETCAGVRAAAVFGVPDAHWGEVVAAAIVADGAAPSDAALAAFARERLASHKRPRFVCYVGRLPQTPGGKLDRRALAALALSLRPLR